MAGKKMCALLPLSPGETKYCIIPQSNRFYFRPRLMATSGLVSKNPGCAAKVQPGFSISPASSHLPFSIAGPRGPFARSLCRQADAQVGRHTKARAGFQGSSGCVTRQAGFIGRSGGGCGSCLSPLHAVLMPSPLKYGVRSTK